MPVYLALSSRKGQAGKDASPPQYLCCFFLRREGMCHALDVCTPCMQRLPERIVEKAVKGMLPSGRIGRHLFTHLKVLPDLLWGHLSSLGCRSACSCHQDGVQVSNPPAVCLTP